MRSERVYALPSITFTHELIPLRFSHAIRDIYSTLLHKNINLSQAATDQTTLRKTCLRIHSMFLALARRSRSRCFSGIGSWNDANNRASS